MKSKRKQQNSKKKVNLITNKEAYITNGDNIEENVINFLKNNNNYRK